MLVSVIKKYMFVLGVTGLAGYSFNAYAMHGREQEEQFCESSAKRQKRIVSASHLLFNAVKIDDKELVEHALTCEANVNARDQWLSTSLHRAKSVGVATLLIAAQADVRAVNNTGETPLHSCRDDAAMVNLLLKAKADVNARDKFGRPPIHGRNDIDVVRAMVKAGARVDLVAQDGNTVLHSVVGEKVLGCLGNNGAYVYVNNANRSGDTPLHKHAAVYFADENAVRLLLEWRANVNAKNCAGKTPLHEVATGSIARLLLEHRADVNIEENDGCTLLHRATRPEIVAALCENGASIEKRNHDGLTPLQQVCYGALWGNKSSLEVIDALLACGADVHAPDDHGQTIVQTVARRYMYRDAECDAIIGKMISKLVRVGGAAF